MRMVSWLVRRSSSEGDGHRHVGPRSTPAEATQEKHHLRRLARASVILSVALVIVLSGCGPVDVELGRSPSSPSAGTGGSAPFPETYLYRYPNVASACDESPLTTKFDVIQYKSPAPWSQPLFHDAAQVSSWKNKIASGRYVNANDVRPGTPGDWARILASAEAFKTAPIVPMDLGAAPDGPTLFGVQFGARDAAFAYLVTGDSSYLAPTIDWLVAQATAPENDTVDACWRPKGGAASDAHFGAAFGLLKFVAAYDFIRADVAEPDRLIIENFLLKAAYFEAHHMGYYLSTQFPNRTRNDYSVVAESAAYEETDPNAYSDLYAYADEAGNAVHEIPIIALFYNNRRSFSELAIGLTGVLLNDPFLVDEAKRYFKEWMAWGLFPDGAQGEYHANWSYGIAQQGLTFGALNVNAAAIMAAILSRFGDGDLSTFSTKEGRFGTQSSSTSKSVLFAATQQEELYNGLLPWYAHPPTGSPPPAENKIDGVNRTNELSLVHDLALLFFTKTTGNDALQDKVLRASEGTYPNSLGYGLDGGNDDPFTGNVGLFPGVFLMYAD